MVALDDACVVCCHGPLEGPAVVDLRDALRDAAQLSGIVLLDARDVVRVNSAGLAVLVGTSRLLRSRGGSFRLAAPSPSMSRALTRSGLRSRLLTDAAGPAGWTDPCLVTSTGVPKQWQPGDS